MTWEQAAGASSLNSPLSQSGGRGPLRERAARRSPLLAAALACLLTGCLPTSQREADRSVSAADSASAALAARTPVDTLEGVWTASPPQPMRLASTISWLGDGLAVVETGQGSVQRFTAAGAFWDATPLPADGYPYGAGTRGDTLVALARGPSELWWIVPGRGVVKRVPAPAGATAALAARGRLAVRVGGGPDTLAPAVVRLDEGGTEVGRTPLTGPPWRSVGFLRAWGDTLLALSGYRPVVDRVAGSGADTLALVGFDSPQLVRSAQFMRGDAGEPPLLAASAAALSDRLFVLNLRDDHLRVDVYGRDGRLRRVLVEPGTREPLRPVPLDLAVRAASGGRGVEIAVLRARPPGLLRDGAGAVALYRWRPAPAEADGAGSGARSAPQAAAAR